MYSYKELLNFKLSKSVKYKKLNIAFLSDQSCQILTKTTSGYGIINSFDFSIWEAPIDQIDNQILSSQSKFNSKEFDLTFCYPYGDYNDTTLSLLEEFNFKLALTTFPGTYNKKNYNLFEIPRWDTNDYYPKKII